MLEEKDFAEDKQNLVPVGACKTCGAPIYGPRHATVGQPIQTQRTCNCAYDKGGLPNVRHT